jgi:hypothetical protein
MASRPEPRSVAAFLPSMNTGAAGLRRCRASEMPISACLDSPGPLTMQPITATCSLDARILARQTGMLRTQISLDVLRELLEHGGGGAAAARAGGDHRHELSGTHGLQEFLGDLTSRVRSPPGSGVSEMRIVSPMPCCSRCPWPRTRRRCPSSPCRPRSGPDAAHGRCVAPVSVDGDQVLHLADLADK